MKSNLHFLSHTKKFSCNMGELIPIACVPCVPGDSIQHHASALIRTQPLLAPLMHKVDVTIHHWFCPLRIIWDDFEDFITGGPDGTDTTERPYVNSTVGTGFAIGSLADYMGITPGVASKPFSALPFRAYAEIWNKRYRDQDLQTPLVISKGNGLDSTTSLTLQNGCWQKDYYTTSRPDPQKGVDVTIPLTGNAPVVGTGVTPILDTATNLPGNLQLSPGGTFVSSATPPAGTADAFFTATTGLETDLSAVSAVNILDLRLATALQRYKENMMRFGSRYSERLLAAFGVANQDARLQDPEYLGGGRQTIQFSEVLQTAEGSDPVGELRGHGIAAMRSNKYRRYIPEFGYIISLMCVRPKTNYAQSIDRHWLYRTKEDFFTPELQHVGQQEVYDGEVYAGAASQYGVFGYQNRYDEYRHIEDRVAGEFRDTLKHWTMARIFASEPSLNADFVTCTPRADVYAAPSADQLYVQVRNDIKAKRKVAKSARSFIF